MRNSLPHVMRSALDQRRIEENLRLPPPFRYVAAPCALHIPHCRQIAAQAIAWLAEAGGPKVAPFPLTATRAPLTYSDITKGRNLRWRRPGSMPATVIALAPRAKRALPIILPVPAGADAA